MSHTQVTHTEVISRGVSEQRECDSHAGNHDDTHIRDLPLAINGPVGGKIGKMTKTGFINR